MKDQATLQGPDNSFSLSFTNEFPFDLPIYVTSDKSVLKKPSIGVGKRGVANATALSQPPPTALMSDDQDAPVTNSSTMSAGSNSSSDISSGSTPPHQLTIIQGVLPSDSIDFLKKKIEDAVGDERFFNKQHTKLHYVRRDISADHKKPRWDPSQCTEGAEEMITKFDSEDEEDKEDSTGEMNDGVRTLASYGGHKEGTEIWVVKEASPLCFGVCGSGLRAVGRNGFNGNDYGAGRSRWWKRSS